jgi:hypothetical protein
VVKGCAALCPPTLHKKSNWESHVPETAFKFAPLTHREQGQQPASVPGQDHDTAMLHPPKPSKTTADEARRSTKNHDAPRCTTTSHDAP